MKEGTPILVQRRWTFFAILAAALFGWTLAVELPARAASINSVRSETLETEHQQAGISAQHEVLAMLRDEREALELRLSDVADRHTGHRGPAAVLNLIEDAAFGAQLALLELRPLEGERATSYARLPIRLRLLGSFEGVLTFLRMIETGRTNMPVREVAIATADGGASAAVEASVLLDIVVPEVSMRPSTEKDGP